MIIVGLLVCLFFQLFLIGVSVTQIMIGVSPGLVGCHVACIVANIMFGFVNVRNLFR